MVVAIFAIFGLILGSFINAAVYRLHEGKPLANDRSECEFCHHKLAIQDLVPLFSWVALRGKCRYCGMPISIQNPLIESLMALLFVVSYLAWSFGTIYSRIYLGIWLLELTGLVIIGLYDLKWKLIPDGVIYVLIGLASASLGLNYVQNHSLAIISSHILAAGLAGLFFFCLHALGKGRWMGRGDINLAFMMGLILGSVSTLVAFVIGFNLAAILSLGLMAAKKVSRKDTIAFGPFLVVGTIVAMLYGGDLFNAYLNIFTR